MACWRATIQQPPDRFACCSATAVPAALASPEGRPVGRFTAATLDAVALPAGYRPAIAAWFASGRSAR